MHPDTVARAAKAPCCDVAEFTRLRYFHGRALSALDLRREQAYHLEKHRFHNRLLHGWGIVCGLEVTVKPADDCDPDDDGAGPVIVLAPGAALDCAGNEVVVRHPRELRLNRLLGAEERAALAAQPATVYLTLCYHEQPLDPSRPLLASGCEPVASCEYGRVAETYRICASTTEPDRGPACEPCCGSCGDRCLELAAIADYDPEAELDPARILGTGRRTLARHELSEIAAINWVHDGTYTREAATELLATGIEVRFSRPVRVASLRRGAVELIATEAGGGRSAGMYHIEGEFHDLPSCDLTDRFVYRSTTDETLQYGDRVTITVRGDFILDECCRAVDGNHLGGSVPTLDDLAVEPVARPDRPPCADRASGNRTEGGDFVSWIVVAERGDQT